MKNILFTLKDQLGDTIACIPSIHGLKDKYINDNIYWDINPVYEDLIPIFCKKYDNGIVYDKVIKSIYWDKNPHGYHHTERAAIECDIEVKKRSLDIPVPIKDKRFVDGLKLYDKFITIGTGKNKSAKNCFQFDARQEFIDCLLKLGYKIIGISGRDGKYMNNIINYKEFSFTVNLEIINRSMLYIGPDSGTTWLAAAAKNPWKICVMDEVHVNKMRDRFGNKIRVGFQNYIDDDKTIDIMQQKGMTFIVDKCLECLECLEKHRIFL